MRQRALSLLRAMVNNQAVFKEDQLEAIESVLNREKTLVVQRTGWGKSMVYFIATKLLREQNEGPTILISPLLSLMRNQIESARKIGINAVTINSSNDEEWDEIDELLSRNQCDILIVSPERLSNQRFINNTLPLIENNGGIGFFVVDEAHCISDWGHDFRPDYRRIVRIVNGLSPNVPILATTATANNRVVRDIEEQLGNDLKIMRGTLKRESLRLSVLHMPDHAKRLAWLAEQIPQMNGTGIIYCTTIGECDRVSSWLQSQGINALPYHSRCEDRELLESKLIRNEIKALVATDALGMGFDKPDLGFVFHYSMPGSLVSYYQQIGRAGRSLSNADVVLLFSEDDKFIHEGFIDSSLPEQSYMEIILSLLIQYGGLSKYELLSKVNFSNGQVDQCLKLLEIDQLVFKQGTKFYRSAKPVTSELLKNENVHQTKITELNNVVEYANTSECLMKFISEELDDIDIDDCGKCQNCIGDSIFPEEVSSSLLWAANDFLYNQPFVIEPRKQWPPNGVGGLRGKISVELRNEEGRALSLYGTAGIGRMVKVARYENGYFGEGLVEATVRFISTKWDMNPQPQWVTSVPSLRNPLLVQSFAKSVAERLGLPYLEVIDKVKHTTEQKYMKNSFLQASNVIDAFSVNQVCPSTPVLLIDDIMNSGWTFTICGVLLRNAGSGPVIPFALSTTPN
ncbi:RecQ family ATP-dependent DNA helicase [Bacillus cabrialesii]|uniref:RecQ family ATP-dependent DNA helicase n=1 Tax=Bacillus cabrialesii TaxID=2487276 RepID=UPI0010114A13|nr:RecQ family ATP-dependent DNA helicase [Bacillus cabrialesii]UQE80247.1 RecQ family ATP-dependent DNA helicase [Bacillus cabrialesii]